MDAKALIYKNIYSQENHRDTFIDVLHEEKYWDMKLFFELYDAINTVASDKTITPEEWVPLAGAVNRISFVIMDTLFCHLNPHDMLTIVNYEQIKAMDCVSRLEIVITCFFEGRSVDEDGFDDDLR